MTLFPKLKAQMTGWFPANQRAGVKKQSFGPLTMHSKSDGSMTPHSTGKMVGEKFWTALASEACKFDPEKNCFVIAPFFVPI